MFRFLLAISLWFCVTLAASAAGAVTAQELAQPTVNVYRDNETADPGTDGPLVDAIEEDRDLKEDPEAYGGMKVACERLVLDGAARSMVIRP